MVRAAKLVPDREGVGRFMAWVVCVLTLLGAFATAGTLALNGAIQAWNADLAGSMTIELTAGDGRNIDKQLVDAIEVLRTTAGVIEVRAVPPTEVAKLLEPWLGRGNVTADLPLPRLIDVRLDPDHPADLGYVEQRLAQIAPDILVDDHKLWLAQLSRLARALQGLALGVVALMALVIVLVVVFGARTALATHREVIEVLYLIGAQDAFIAAHFQRHALRMALTGGLVGLALAVAGMLGLEQLTRELKGPLVGQLSLAWWHWPVLALLPVCAAVMASLTARWTVLRGLRRMP